MSLPLSNFPTSTPMSLEPKPFQKGAKLISSEPYKVNIICETLDWDLYSLCNNTNIGLIKTYAVSKSLGAGKSSLTSENQTDEWVNGPTQNGFKTLSQDLWAIVLTSPVHWSHTNSDLYIGDIGAVVIHGATWPATNEWMDTSNTSHGQYLFAGV